MTAVQPPPETAASPPGAGHSVWLMLPPVMLAMSLAFANQTIVPSALPAIASDLGGVDMISWVIIVYLMTNAMSSPVYGRLGDMLGRRRMMLATLTVFMLGCVLCALAWRMEVLIAARALQGIGGGGLMTLSQALIGDFVTPRERGRYQGYFAAVNVGVTMTAPVMGGVITEYLGWRYVFLFSLPLGMLALAMALRLPELNRPTRKGRFDMPGLVLYILTVLPLLLAIQKIQGLEASAVPLVIALLVVTLVSLFFLIRQERRSPAPLFPLQLMRNTTIWRSDVVALCHGAAIVSLITYTPLYLRVVKGSQATEIGFLLLTLGVGVGIGSAVVGRLITRTGRTMLFPSLGMTGGCTAVVALAFLAGPISVSQLPWLFIWISICAGTVMSVLQTNVQNVAGPTSFGAASGSLQFSRSLGATAGTAITGAVMFLVLALSGPDSTRLFSEMMEHGPAVLDALPEVQRTEILREVTNAFTGAYLAVAGFLGLGAAMSWSIPARRV